MTPEGAPTKFRVSPRASGANVIAPQLCKRHQSLNWQVAYHQDVQEPSAIIIRPAGPMDRPPLAQARVALWPDATLEQHDAEVMGMLSGHAMSTLPLDILVAESAGAFVGFIEVGLRSHADGCDARRPVAFIEGWYVAPQDRRRGVGRALMAAAEEWGRAHGCLEVASDTWIDHDLSQRAHEALGFTVVDRCVHYRKSL